MLEFSCSTAGSGEDGNTVSLWVGIHQLDGVVEGINSDNAHNWGKDFLVVAGQSWLGMVDDSWSKEIALFKSWHVRVSAIQ